MNWYLEAVKKYAVFSGRARRKEYWFFVLFNIIFTIVASVLDKVIFGTAMEGVGPLYCVYAIGIFLPSLAVSVRRLHDVGKSGWFLLIALIPIIGAIWLLVLVCRDSDPADNQYGANPKASRVSPTTASNATD